jgi:hypothetical protein
MAQRKRTLRQWLAADFTRALGPRKVVRLFKAYPSLWLWLVIYLGVAFAVYGGVLAAVGKLDDFGTWIFIPGLMGTSFFSGRLESIWQKHQQSARSP